VRRSTNAPSLASLSTHDNDGNVVTVIETPKDTRTKLAFDDKSQWFKVKKVLPEGMMFPFNFGFIPSTLSDDGDPLDVLVLMDEAVPTGTIVPSRLVGAIEADQTEKDGSTDENPRLIAVADACEIFRDVRKLSDLPIAVVKQIEHFFVSYNKEQGKRFKPTGRRGPKRAAELLKKAARSHRKKDRG
jgi:inorganic pyrophosphatase